MENRPFFVTEFSPGFVPLPEGELGPAVLKLADSPIE